ncbi:MAG TPA: AbrB/MazE/SpoVT family DNA-binding domain-containing protein [Thermoplasmata archaeon]
MTTTKVSRNGQVVIPKEIRDRLGLRPGDSLVAADVGGRIVLSPARKEALKEEFDGLMAEFDRKLRGLRLPEGEVVRIVRRVRRGR